jgi:hypothetical protein
MRYGNDNSSCLHVHGALVVNGTDVVQLQQDLQNALARVQELEAQLASD